MNDVQIPGQPIAPTAIPMPGPTPTTESPPDNIEFIPDFVTVDRRAIFWELMQDVFTARGFGSVDMGGTRLGATFFRTAQENSFTKAVGKLAGGQIYNAARI